MWFDPDFARRVEEAVATAETDSDAELVIVVARRSGTYRDLSLLVAIAASALALGFILFSPWDFPVDFVPGLVAAAGAVAFCALEFVDGIGRTLMPRSRQAEQVKSAAAAAFHEEVVHGTRGRTGLLLYVSVREGRLEVVPDLGLQAKVADAHWNAVDFGGGVVHGHLLSTPDDFLKGLDTVGKLLAQHVPALDDNPNEIHDAPRFRP